MTQGCRISGNTSAVYFPQVSTLEMQSSCTCEWVQQGFIPGVPNKDVFDSSASPVFDDRNSFEKWFLQQRKHVYFVNEPWNNTNNISVLHINVSLNVFFLFVSLLWIALGAVTASSWTGHFDCMALNGCSCGANRGIRHLALITEMSRLNRTNTAEMKEMREMKENLVDVVSQRFVGKRTNIWLEKEETRSCL